MRTWNQCVKQGIIVAAIASAACTSTNNEETATDERDLIDDLIDDFESFGCATADTELQDGLTAEGSAGIADAGETACIAWTLNDDGALTVECMNITTECGGPQHGLLYQDGAELVLRTYKDPVSTGECDTAGCVCPESFSFKATVSVPANGMTLLVESGGCAREKEEELARIDIPSAEIHEGIRCNL